MTIKKHLKTAGTIQIICDIILGILLLIFTIHDFARVGLPNDISNAEPITLLPVALPVFAIIILCFQVYFGYALTKRKHWATGVIGFIWCILGLFSFPVGTVINGYTLWVLTQVDKQSARRKK